VAGADCETPYIAGFTVRRRMSDPTEQSLMIGLDKATELRLLAYDVALIQGVCQATAEQRVIEVPTEGHQRYLSIIGDLWYRLVNHAKPSPSSYSQGYSIRLLW
jgi:hypothetical protein